MFYFYDASYILVLIAIVISLWAQTKLKSTYAKYGNVMARSGLTGADVASKILRENGLTQVGIGHVAGSLTDHYDPRTNTVSLSDTVYNSTSIAALGVAAHEVGHAIQKADSYFPMTLRSYIIPITQIGAQLSWPALLLGLFLQTEILITIGLLLYSTMFLFQLITLPVEFNASNRAIAALESGGILVGEELEGTKKVLRAAALTYVAAMLASLLNLIRLIAIFGRRR